MVRVLNRGLFLMVAASFSMPGIAFGGNPVITLDYPNASQGVNTLATGIDGSSVVGYSDDGGFLYNLATSTFAAMPVYRVPQGAYGLPEAWNVYACPCGISDNSIVGYFRLNVTDIDHGFVYNRSTSAYISLDDPNAGTGGLGGTVANDVSGNNTVGTYFDSSQVFHGFLYNLSTSAYTTLDEPLSAQKPLLDGTSALGISGNYVVGLYYDSTGAGHGFIYNISSKQYTTLDDPLAAGYTDATGIDGNLVCGEYFDASNNKHLFLYDIATATYTTLNIDLPGPLWLASGISGNTIVGIYSDTSYFHNHGFVATVPEPSTLTLLAAVGLVSYSSWRRKKRV